MNGNKDIQDQVREFLGDDDGSGAEPSVLNELKAKIVTLLSHKGFVVENFPAERPYVYLVSELGGEVDEHGLEPLLQAIRQVEAELEEAGFHLPNYLRQDHQESKIEEIVAYAEFIEHCRQRDAKEAAEKLRRQDFIDHYSSP